jgi:hypothetical protein
MVTVKPWSGSDGRRMRRDPRRGAWPRGPPLDVPASPAVLEQGGAATLHVTRFALAEALSGGSPEPALVALSLPP